MKISYKRIRTNIDWDHKVISYYYGLVATDFHSKEELDQSHVLAVLMRRKPDSEPFLPVYSS